MTDSKPATQQIKDQHARVLASLPFDDKRDFANAERGFRGRLKPNIVKNDQDVVIWDNDAYEFLRAEAQDTANPSLWRQSRLAHLDGLYHVTDGIYQVRGLDLSNTTFIEGDQGVIVIDPLTSQETGAAAWAHQGNHLHTLTCGPLWWCQRHG